MKFAKYHGCGNDFLIVNYQDNINFSNVALKYCNRNLGIGADGFIVVKDNPLEMLFYNADGTRGAMCGNGVRCFAKYCIDNHIVEGTAFDVSTLSGMIKLTCNSDGSLVTANMGKPLFSNKKMHLQSDIEPFLNQNIIIDNQSIVLNAVFMTTHHVVIFTDNIDKIVKTNIGQMVCFHELFINQTNVNFVQVIDSTNLVVRTFERGVGWTLACGSGSCAAFVIANLQSKCKRTVKIHLKYGILNIFYDENENVIMEGPAEKIFDNLYVNEDLFI